MFDGSYGDGPTRNGAYLQGGVTLLRMLFGWYRDWVPKVSFGPPPRVDRESWFQSPYADAYTSQPVAQSAVDLDAHLKTLPVFDLLDRSGAAPSEFAAQMRASSNPASDFFADQGFLTEADLFHTPNIFITGPLERGGSSFENFRLFRQNAENDVTREHQYLWFTPAVHSGYAECTTDTRFGARSFGDTRFPYYRRLVDWFAHWLRDDRLELADWPKVRYFVAGRNRWEQADSWPPADVRSQQIYLAPQAGLSWDASDEEGRDEYLYDPGDPTPSEPEGTPVDILGGGYADRRTIEARDDVLTFTSEPLTNPLALAGPVSVELFVSSSAPDTDFACVLTEVDAEGRSINITHGIVRARYRDGLDQPTRLEPGQIYRLAVDLWHAAIELPAGSCLRLAISSAYFPVFDRNLNTGDDNFTTSHHQPANNNVHFGGACPSSICLPVLAR